MKPEKDRSKSKKKSVGGDEASVAKKDKSSRRATFAGSRLSLHSLRFFPSLSKEKETVSRSAADLGDELVLSVGDSGSEADSEVRTTPACKVKMKECPLCFLRLPSSTFPRLSCCPHRSCHSCMVQYLQMEIVESRIVISCPECTELIHPNDIYKLLAEQPHLIQKFEEFSLRRLLLADPDTRWCPAPDCGYAVIASGCAACPELRCERPGCGATFCYHCKMAWHPNQTCDEARTQRGSTSIAPHHFDPAIRPGDIKACPRCHTYIVKMNDGSCNHMVCALCGSEFCWLCLKEISDLHYLSPSGCTFWGKKPWSRKKKLLWQLGTLVGAPVGIALIAGLAVPAIIFGFPVFVGKKVYQKMHDKPQKHRRRMAVIGGVVGSFLISPVLASMAVGVGVPVLLAYVYGVVPLSLCRSGGCGVDSSGSIKLDENDDFYGVANLADQEKASLLREDGQSMAVSNVTAMSIHSGSSASAVAHQGRLHVQVDVCTSTRRRPSIESGAVSLGNYEEASMKAMAGSTHCDDKSVHTMSSLAEGGSYCEDGASTAALAGSVFENKSICAMDNASVRALAGSIAPDTLSAKYHIDRSSPAPLLEEDIVGDLCDNDRDYKHSSEPPHSKRKSIGDNISVPSSSRQSRSRSVCIHQQLSSSSGDDTTDNASRRLLSVSPRYDASGVHPDQDLSSVKEGAEYLMVSTEAIRSIPLHPANASHKKARSASLLDSAPVELWSLLMDSPTEPWSVFSRVREAGTQGKWITTATPYRVTTGSASSYTSLPDPNPSLTPSNPPARSRTFHFPKFAPFSKKSRDKP